MLRIIRSNEVESLLTALALRIGGQPPASPFEPELVVVPSPAMGRWVNLQLAGERGVAANLDYPLPSSYVWRLCAGLLDGVPKDDPLALDALAWRVFGLLPALLDGADFEPLRRYLGHDSDGLKRWQLASRIGDVFDRYQLYRPGLIRDWGQGGGDDWQALLWRRLIEGLEMTHRVAVIDRLLEHLAAPGAGDGLPSRVSFFAVSSLPPLLMEVIHALATRVPVDFYLHAPTDAFWADLVSSKEQARVRLQRPEEADLWEVGNGLLASWGRQGQALQDLLLSSGADPDEVDVFAPPPEDGALLHRIQAGIFALSPTPAPAERPAVAADDSLQVHVCHGPLRECQVLHDQLLAMLEAEPDLSPEDILVMVPEISRYAPYIEAVFAREADGRQAFIPWNLSDISVKDEHPLVAVFLQLLGLPESRFSHSEVLSYLDVPELASHFGLDGDAVALIKEWLALANLRWGLDGAHKQRLDLPATEQNTWAQAEQRLFAGYALGDRYLFLETLLCARRRLYLSYVGRDMRRNAERQPSVLLRELLDYLDQHYRPADGDEDARLSARLTRLHPLQPFSPSLYRAPAASYDPFWCRVAQALAPDAEGPSPGVPGFPSARLPPAPERMRELTLIQLERFLRHPLRYFVTSRLRMYLREDEQEEDEEVFALDHLAAYGLRQRLADGYLREREIGIGELTAEGALPHGAFADLEFAAQGAAVAPLLARLDDYRGHEPRRVPVDLAFDVGGEALRLSGQVTGIRPDLGLLRYRPGSLRGADLLGLWLSHLAWSAMGGGGASTLLGRDEGFVLREPLAPDAAYDTLAELMDLYWEGVHRPLPVLPKATFAYARKAFGEDSGDPMSAARYAWEGNAFKEIPGDMHDPNLQLLLRGVDGNPLDLPEFTELAETLYGRLLGMGEEL